MTGLLTQPAHRRAPVPSPAFSRSEWVSEGSNDSSFAPWEPLGGDISPQSEVPVGPAKGAGLPSLKLGEGSHRLRGFPFCHLSPQAALSPCENSSFTFCLRRLSLQQDFSKRELMGYETNLVSKEGVINNYTGTIGNKLGLSWTNQDMYSPASLRSALKKMKWNQIRTYQCE